MSFQKLPPNSFGMTSSHNTLSHDTYSPHPHNAPSHDTSCTFSSPTHNTPTHNTPFHDTPFLFSMQVPVFLFPVDDEFYRRDRDSRHCRECRAMVLHHP